VEASPANNEVIGHQHQRDSYDARALSPSSQTTIRPSTSFAMSAATSGSPDQPLGRGHRRRGEGEQQERASHASAELRAVRQIGLDGAAGLVPIAKTHHRMVRHQRQGQLSPLRHTAIFPRTAICVLVTQ
jgi:hypothetical protein